MVPVQAEYYSLEGFSMLMNSVKMIQRRINRNLKIFGVVMTMVDARSKLSRHVCDRVALSIPNKLFSTSIRRLVNVAEAPWSGAPTVLLNKPTSSGAGAGSLEYWTLARNSIDACRTCAANSASVTLRVSLKHRAAANPRVDKSHFWGFGPRAASSAEGQEPTDAR